MAAEENDARAAGAMPTTDAAKPRSKEVPREAKARDRARIRPAHDARRSDRTNRTAQLNRPHEPDRRTTRASRHADAERRRDTDATNAATSPEQRDGRNADSRAAIRRTAPFHLAQARHVSQDPLPDQARHTSALRANPYPEVTDPICRLPLPTLVYRLEALHLGDLLRIWVRTGATPPRGPHLDFQGPRGRSGHRRNCGALRVPNHISLLEDSMELERLCRKENSSRISRRRLQVILGCPDELSCEGPTY
jgi:hypothetical protein